MKNFNQLKKMHRGLRDTYEESFSIRIHRSLSWLNRAEQEDKDIDAKFIFIWISLNSAYSIHLDSYKNHGDHTLPMTEDTKGIFERRVSEGGQYVFASPLGKLKPMTASKTFTRVSEEVGFVFTAHDLRRTVATVAADRGYDINSIGAVLNHSRQGVTEGYIQRTQPRLKQILQDIEAGLF